MNLCYLGGMEEPVKISTKDAAALYLGLEVGTLANPDNALSRLYHMPAKAGDVNCYTEFSREEASHRVTSEDKFVIYTRAEQKTAAIELIHVKYPDFAKAVEEAMQPVIASVVADPQTMREKTVATVRQHVLQCGNGTMMDFAVEEGVVANKVKDAFASLHTKFGAELTIDKAQLTEIEATIAKLRQPAQSIPQPIPLVEATNITPFPAAAATRQHG